jgi:acetyltransferase-like isoleucine patch superfamily enzyme
MSTDHPVLVHPSALVETSEMGRGTRVWAFAHILAGAKVGADCNICDHVFIESGAVVGNSVVVKNGVSIWDGVTLEDRVFIGPNVAFTNDKVPRAKVFHDEVQRTNVALGASIGANATILCGIRLGRYCLVGAGAVVTRDVPDHVVVAGNPARPTGHVCRCGVRLRFIEDLASCRCGAHFLRKGSLVQERQ